MPSLHSKGTSYLLAAAFMIGIAGNVSAATSPVTLSDLSTDLRLLVLGLKSEVDRLSKENKNEGAVAHQGERHVRNVEVVGSSPIDSTIFFIRNTLYPRIQSSKECSCSL